MSSRNISPFQTESFQTKSWQTSSEVFASAGEFRRVTAFTPMSALQRSPCPRNPTRETISHVPENNKREARAPIRSYLRPPSPPQPSSLGTYSPHSSFNAVCSSNQTRCSKRISPPYFTGESSKPLSSLFPEHLLLSLSEGGESDDDVHPFDFGNEADVFDNANKRYFVSPNAPPDTRMASSNFSATKAPTPTRRTTFEAGYFSGLRTKKRSFSSSASTPLGRPCVSETKSPCEKGEHTNSLDNAQSTDAMVQTPRSSQSQRHHNPLSHVRELEAAEENLALAMGPDNKDKRYWTVTAAARPLRAMDGTRFGVAESPKNSVATAGGFAPPPEVMADALDAMNKLLLLTERSLDRHYGCPSRWRAIAREPKTAGLNQNNYPNSDRVNPPTSKRHILEPKQNAESHSLIGTKTDFARSPLKGHTWPTPVVDNTACLQEANIEPGAPVTEPLATQARVSENTSLQLARFECTLGENANVEDDSDLLEQLLGMLRKQKEQHDREFSELAQVVAELRRSKLDDQ